MNAGPPRRRRARPVGDAPVDELLARVEDLAKGWLLAVVEDAPLEQAPLIFAGALPRDGPRVCDAIVRALADDRDLRRLDIGGPLESLASGVGELVGARDLDATARAVQALHAVIWAALLEELSDPEPDEISGLAERLTGVIELVRRAALRRCGTEPQPVPRPVAVPDPLQGDERGDQPEPTLAAQDRRDPSALWLSALEDEIAFASRTGAPLALLLADLEDGDRVLAVEPRSDASATFGRFAQAVRAALRRQDILACETDTRAWIVARDTGRAGADVLGARISTAVNEAGNWRGAPLRVSVGVAVLGEDGEDSGGLIEAAEEATFAAASSGIGIVRSVPGGEPPVDGGSDGPRLVG